ncbi:MAG: DUF1593 domain-containing protein [Candidatus Latescibacteria bacterium]|nr:DUF1593 domain-containing protein [Candidatus Latescibacterota bacterium]
MTYRVLVSTDLGGDPDDIQSLYRLVHYSDILRVEGITSCTGPGSQPSADLIRHWIRRIDVDHLRTQGYPELMTEDQLLDGVVQGATTAGPPGLGQATAGSRKIVERALAEADDILWVAVWGSITDVAQALHDAPAIAPRIRINYIGSSNTVNDPAARDFVYQFMAEQYPQLWWIENGVLPKLSRDTFRGVYQGGQQDGGWGNIAFIEQHIRHRGTTHNGLFAEKCGDAFPVATWPAGSLKEGDSPTLLHLLSPPCGNVGDVDDPTAESWGGQYRRPAPQRFPNYYADLDADAATCQETIARWRVAFLSHWQKRWLRY